MHILSTGLKCYIQPTLVITGQIKIPCFRNNDFLLWLQPMLVQWYIGLHLVSRLVTRTLPVWSQPYTSIGLECTSGNTSLLPVFYLSQISVIGTRTSWYIQKLLVDIRPPLVVAANSNQIWCSQFSFFGNHCAVCSKPNDQISFEVFGTKSLAFASTPMLNTSISITNNLVIFWHAKMIQMTKQVLGKNLECIHGQKYYQVVSCLVGPTMEFYRKTKEMMPHLIIILCIYQEPCARIQKEGVKHQIIVDNVVALIGSKSVYILHERCNFDCATDSSPQVSIVVMSC